MGKIFSSIFLIIAVVVILFVFKYSSKNPTASESITPVPAETGFVDGKYCFSRVQKATSTEPYSVEEHIVLTISDTTVTGTKSGTQAGPDMTNGYTGSLSGTRTDNVIEVTYAYTVEGSKNKELENYEYKNGFLVKLRWPLVEKNKILVPDKTGKPTLITYNKEVCT